MVVRTMVLVGSCVLGGEHRIDVGDVYALVRKG